MATSVRGQSDANSFDQFSADRPPRPQFKSTLRQSCLADLHPKVVVRKNCVDTAGPFDQADMVRIQQIFVCSQSQEFVSIGQTICIKMNDAPLGALIQLHQHKSGTGDPR